VNPWKEICFEHLLATTELEAANHAVLSHHHVQLYTMCLLLVKRHACNLARYRAVIRPYVVSYGFYGSMQPMHMRQY
jgi:hypothetical protein